MDNKTIHTYDQIAEEYDSETIDFWERFPATFINKFKESLSGNKILDAGCGPGRDAVIFSKEGLSVTCLDASESMVILARTKGMEAVKGDLLALPFADESFDGVWAYTSLLHLPKEKISEALKEIKRVLNDGGVFGLGLIEGEGELYKESAGENRPRLFSFYHKKEVEDLLEQYGFKVMYFEEFKVNTKNYLNFIAEKIHGHEYL